LSKQGRVIVACPHCSHQQSEPLGGYSTVCKKCRRHFRIEEALNPARQIPKTGPEQRRITCFECQAPLDVPATAESTMCKRCSRYVDLKDYHIEGAISKNFKTKGLFVIEPRGYVFNTESLVGDAVIKGRLLGKLVAERQLTIHTTAEIKGSFTAGCLVIPAANHFYWKDPIHVGSAEIAGELTGRIHATHQVLLRSTARFFGNVEADELVVEEGAVLVGHAQAGIKSK
jgi:cytoskeletal protein CcmA (bactofilin family)